MKSVYVGAIVLRPGSNAYPADIRLTTGASEPLALTEMKEWLIEFHDFPILGDPEVLLDKAVETGVIERWTCTECRVLR